MSFWDHLEVLRGTLFRSILAITIISVVVFCFKKFVFDDVVLAPTRSDFWVYRLFNMDVKMNLVNNLFGMLCKESVSHDASRSGRASVRCVPCNSRKKNQYMSSPRGYVFRR